MICVPVPPEFVAPLAIVHSKYRKDRSEVKRTKMGEEQGTLAGYYP